MAATSTCLGGIMSTSGLFSPCLGSHTRDRIALGLGPRPLLIVTGSAKKKIQTKQPFGPSGGTKFRDGLDASGRKITGKGLYQFSNKYGANVDGYSPIYDPNEWSPSGDVYVGGTSGLLIWAITLGALLLGGALLVYNTSALSQ